MSYIKAITKIEQIEAPPIREIMDNSRLEKIQINKISLAQINPVEDYEDFALKDLIEEVRDNGVVGR